MSTEETVPVWSPNARESGVAIIVVMMFALVFLALGAALFVLIRTSQSSTELERKEVKAFNVAEAGVDAGMLALKLHWPSMAGAPLDATALATLEVQVRSQMQATNPGLRDPQRSSSKFVEIQVYDNVDAGGLTTTVPYPGAPKWDSNLNSDGTRGDGRMFVDSRADVDDDRHRIVILAEQQIWDFSIPGRALFAGSAGMAGLGQGLRVHLEGPPPPDPVLASWGDDYNAGVETGPGITRDGPQTQDTFDQIMPSLYLDSLKAIAEKQHTYYETDDTAEAFLQSGNASGQIVYVESSSAIDIGGNTVMGDQDHPIVLVIKPLLGAAITIDWTGSAEFYGVVILLGDALLRGTTTIHGAVLSSGLLKGDGQGRPNSPEIAYNQNVINRANHQYIKSVNIVPNTWEEYTIAPGAAY